MLSCPGSAFAAVMTTLPLYVPFGRPAVAALMVICACRMPFGVETASQSPPVAVRATAEKGNPKNDDSTRICPLRVLL